LSDASIQKILEAGKAGKIDEVKEVLETHFDEGQKQEIREQLKMTL